MIFYNFIIILYSYTIRFAALLGNSKAKLFIKYKAIEIPKRSNISTIWIHAASAGEGNQAIPIVKALKKRYDSKIIISFFSPSGYDFHKNSSHFDEVINLPLDSKQNAISLINKLNPRFAIFIKNELWWNYLNELNKQKIPTFLVNASRSILSPGNFVLDSYQLKCLKLFTKIFATTKPDSSKSHQLSLGNTIGDTKYESSFSINKNVAYKNIENFIGDQKCIILGSSWPQEEKFIMKWLDETSNNTYKIIIAPHEIGDQRIKELQFDFKNSTLYTNINSDAKVLILNKIGILKNVYRYADIAIIGGGFNKGIHNILEAVTFHIPVLFGPKYQKFEEATDLLDKKLVFSFSDYLQLHILLDKFINNTNKTEYITSQLAQFVEQNHNVSNEIINEISDDITLQTLNPK